MFNIPNNTKPSLSLGGGQAIQPQQTQQQYAQQPIQQQYSQSPTGRGVSLVKGQKVSLSKMDSALRNIKVCLGWDVGDNYDLDTEAFILGSNGRVLGDSWLVFYNQPSSPDGAINHSGDNKTGQGDGDDEIISIDLSRVNQNVDKIVFTVTINEAVQRNLNFSGVRNAFVRVINAETNIELVRFDLSQYFGNFSSLIVGELYLRNGEWKFNSLANGVNEDLFGLCTRYGINVN